MCSAMERYRLCYAKDIAKRRNTECRQRGAELSLTDVYSFMHPFHMAGADLSEVSVTLPWLLPLVACSRLLPSVG